MLKQNMIREKDKNDLEEILELYLYLHETDIPEDSERLRNTKPANRNEY